MLPLRFAGDCVVVIWFARFFVIIFLPGIFTMIFFAVPVIVPTVVCTVVCTAIIPTVIGIVGVVIIITIVISWCCPTCFFSAGVIVKVSLCAVVPVFYPFIILV